MNKLEKEILGLKETIKTFETLNLSYVSTKGQVKMIAWGKDYNSWELSKKVEFTEALASALNEGLEIMQNERNIAMEEALKLQKLLEESNKAITILRETNINAITQFNKEKQDMIKTIRDLEGKLTEAEKTIFTQAQTSVEK